MLEVFYTIGKVMLLVIAVGINIKRAFQISPVSEMYFHCLKSEGTWMRSWAKGNQLYEVGVEVDLNNFSKGHKDLTHLGIYQHCTVHPSINRCFKLTFSCWWKSQHSKLNILYMKTHSLNTIVSFYFLIMVAAQPYIVDFIWCRN